MTRSSRFLAAPLLVLAIAACDRMPDAAGPTPPVSPNTLVEPEERIGPGVLEEIRAGRNPRIVVALQVPELAAPEAGLRLPPGLPRLRGDVATAQRSAIGRAKREALVALRQYETVPAFSANVRSEEAVRAMASDPSVRRIDLDVGGTGQLASSVRVIGADERYE